MSACEGAPDAEVAILKNKKGFLRIYIVFDNGRICIDFDLRDGKNAMLMEKDLLSALRKGNKATCLDFGSCESFDRNFETTFKTVPEMIRYLQQRGFQLRFQATNREI